MRCPSGHRVPAGSRFCPECGVELTSEACPQCGSLLVPAARFCTACGAEVGRRPAEPAAPATPPASEELRQITALFCDIVGSTELSARLDPEEYGEVVAFYRERLDAIAAEFGGSIDKYLGDGALVVFGWPQAHDDDAERAVTAALAMVEQLPAVHAAQPLAIRVGIHTGPVLVGEIGSPRHRETTALGETMNRAARLQACAPEQGVVVSDSTLRLIRGLFVVEDLGPHDLPGIAEPVSAYRVLRRSGVRSKLDAAGESLTPFVSRDAELGALVGRWDEATRGEGQAVLLLGEPGIGKSRLVYELRERLAGTAHTWLEARGSSYTQHSAFAAAIQLLETALELRPEEPVADRLARLELALDQAGLREADALPIIARLLSIEGPEVPEVVMSPQLARRRTIDLLARWVLALADAQPLVLLVEDLHWCDPSTLLLFEQLIVQGLRSPLMLVGTARPDLEADWEDHPNLTSLRLEPLSDDDTRELLRRVGSGRELPDEVVGRIVSESDGIPLFAEEIGRMVLESGLIAERDGQLALIGSLDELDIPTTLQDSLMARLDRLSAAKRVAQLAAAVGREFEYRLLDEVADLDRDTLLFGLRRLLEDDLLFVEGTPPDATYTFKHALIQDAAYRSLLRRSRRALHRRVAEALERRRGIAPEVLARHWEGAGEAAEAIRYYQLAAEEGARQSAHREAIAHLRRGIELVEELEDRERAGALEVDLQLALGSSIMAIGGYADPEVEKAYDRARTLCAQLGEGTQAGYTLIGLSIFYFNSGQVTAGAELATRALEIAEREDDDTLELLARVQIAIPSWLASDFVAARHHAEAAHALYDPSRHAWLAFRYGTDQGVAALCIGGAALTSSGFPDHGIQRSARALELARELGNPFNETYALTFEAGIRWGRGEIAEVETAADAAIAIAQRQGFSDFAGIGKVLRGGARALREGDPNALDDCLEGMSLAASTGRRGMAPLLLEVAAGCQRTLGNRRDAGEVVAGALALGAETGQHFWDPRLYRLRAELARDGGDLAAAEQDYGRGMELASAQGDPLSELGCATSLARMLADRGDADAPERIVRPVFAKLSEGFGTPIATDAAALLGEAEPVTAG
jgi:class 3 adenylate cyclase/tetratricopeptide (TPR) repeat protein